MDALLHFDNLPTSLVNMNFSDQNNNEDFETSPVSTKEDKYSLRPRSVRRVTEAFSKLAEETHKEKSTKNQKPKQKPAPLSKYRRKTANARERNRMREINQAFETLRRVIPHFTSHMPGSNEKLTKITTLRLAMKYITSLSAVLNGSSEIQQDFTSECSDFESFLLESDGESLPLSDHSLLASPDFPEPSLSPVDFNDPTLPSFLHNDFSDPCLESTDFSDILLT